MKRLIGLLLIICCLLTTHTVSAQDRIVRDFYASLSANSNEIFVFDLSGYPNIAGNFGVQILETNGVSGTTCVIYYSESLKDDSVTRTQIEYTAISGVSGIDFSSAATPYVQTIYPDPADFYYIKVESHVTGFTLWGRFIAR